MHEQIPLNNVKSEYEVHRRKIEDGNCRKKTDDKKQEPGQ